MKKSVPNLYAEYGRHIDKERAIPLHIDLLKPVERRVLYTLYDIKTNDLVKSARVVGLAIAMYHPHGDASTYGTLVNLVDKGWVYKKGNFGQYGKENLDAGQYRYTEVRKRPEFMDFAFNLVKYVKWGDPEKLKYEQPLYLTTPVPLGLIASPNKLGNSVIVGIAFNTCSIPKYHYSDLIKRLTNLFQRQTDPNIPEVIIEPYFYEHKVVEAEPGEFKKILTTGVGNVIIYPRMSVDNDGVHVYGYPPKGVSKWINYCERREAGKIDIIDLSGSITSNDNKQKKKSNKKNKNENHNNNFHLIFVPPKGTKIDQDFINEIFELTISKVNFLCNVVDENEIIITKSIDELLINSYTLWVKHLLDHYQDKKKQVDTKLFELDVLVLVRQIIHENNLKLIKVDDIIELFENKYKQINSNITSENIRHVCTKYNIKTLIEHKTNRSELEKELLQINQDITNINTIGYNLACSYKI
jgi:hypothetical protein